MENLKQRGIDAYFTDCKRLGKDINMSFGLDKYAILLITNEKYTTTNICPDIPKFDDEENRGYQYLGVMEGVDFHMTKVKALAVKDYVSLVFKILNADMNGDYTMTAICAHMQFLSCNTCLEL
eukprot:3046511-Ditylum_brightwellii.AAC.1